MVGGLILFLSSRPVIQPQPPPFAQADKLAHFVEYAIFSALILRFWLSRGFGLFSSVTLCVAVTATFAAGDEILQFFVAGRQPDVADYVTDLISAGITGTLIGRFRLFGSLGQPADVRTECP